MRKTFSIIFIALFVVGMGQFVQAQTSSENKLPICQWLNAWAGGCSVTCLSSTK